MFEAGIVQTYWQSAMAFATGNSPGPLGSAHPLNAPYQAFPTSDGWINVGAANQTNWLKLLDALNAPALAADPCFIDNEMRMRNLDTLIPALNDVFATRPTAEWLDRLEAVGLPAGPILSVEEMHRDPQTLAREMVMQTSHSRLGKVETIGAPVKFSASAAGVRRGAPVLGEHSREVLAGYGYDGPEIDRLVESGVIIAG